MSDSFGVVDYLVFISMLLISTAIGFYFAWKDRNNTSQDEFLRGGKHMSPLPVCLSIMASFLPSTSFIGFSTVVYATGTQFWVIIFPLLFAAFVAMEVFIPVYYNMNLTSVNEYIHKRFKSHRLKVITNISTLIAYIPFFGVELFAPAIALSIVTDMNISACIITIGIVVTLYTTMGGLKGVIWTDCMQLTIMFIGLTAVLIKGANVSGGMAKAFDKAYQGGRIEFWNMDFDIYQTNSFWMYIFGFGTLWVGTFSTSQLQIQRSVCMPTLKSAKLALYLAVPGIALMITILVVIGVVMYARFYDCDPMMTGRVTRPDQLLPYFVLNIFEDDYPGIPGLFVATIFGGSLSTLSSGINAMAAIVWDDYAKKMFRRLKPEYHVYAVKILSIVIGIISISFAFIAKGTNNILEAAVMIYGGAVGPVFALFCLGLFFPWVNAIGGAAGIIIGEIFAFWIVIGSVSDKRPPMYSSLPFSTDACDARNITVYMRGPPLAFMKDYKIPEYNPTGMDRLYHITPFFVPVVGFITTLIIGNIVSLATKGNCNQVIDRDMINMKVCRLFERILPESWRQLQNEMPTPRARSPNNRQFTQNPIHMKPIGDQYYGEEEDQNHEQTTLPVIRFNTDTDRTTNI